jgi:hypothetical protein
MMGLSAFKSVGADLRAAFQAEVLTILARIEMARRILAARSVERMQLRGDGLFILRDAGVAYFHGRNYKRTLLSGPALLFSRAYEGAF